MSIHTNQIRTIAIAGHSQSGKTSLLENILAVAKAIEHAEPVQSGKTISDYTAEEIQRSISIYASLAHFAIDDVHVNIWDTPGASDFVGEVVVAFRSAENAIIVLDAKEGVQIETIKYWRDLDRRNKSRVIFANKMDEARADFNRCLTDVKQQFSVDVCPITIPMGSGTEFLGVIDVLRGKAYEITPSGEREIPIPQEYQATYKRAKEVLAGAAAEGDEELLVTFIDEGMLSDAEIERGLQLAIKDNRIVPLFAGSAEKQAGLQSLLHFIKTIMPSPEGALERSINVDAEELSVKIDESQELSALVIKTANDQFSGKLSYIKVVTGVLNADSEIINISDQKKDKVGKLYRTMGKKLTEVKSLHAGDIGVAVKLSSAKTNDTLANTASVHPFVSLRTPDPIYSLAVSAENKKNDDKLSSQLLRACEEDMTLSFAYNPEIRQNVFSGMGDLHIGIILERVEKNAKLQVLTSVPRVAYRETIRQKAQAEYTHKKQSGGHGQFGRVVLSVQPLERGGGFAFSNAVFGGAISKGYIPGVEKGIKEAMEHGVLAGYPVVDVSSTVLDGKEHPVDSSEMAFKIASRNAFKEAMRNAGPILLEPVMHLTVYADNRYLGDIMSDLSSRRGKILGQSSLANGIEEIRSYVPQKELLRYAIELRSMTSGTGSFEVAFDHYDPISGRIADEIIREAKAFIEEESDS